MKLQIFAPRCTHVSNKILRKIPFQRPSDQLPQRIEIFTNNLLRRTQWNVTAEQLVRSGKLACQPDHDVTTRKFLQTDGKVNAAFTIRFLWNAGIVPPASRYVQHIAAGQSSLPERGRRRTQVRFHIHRHRGGSCFTVQTPDLSAMNLNDIYVVGIPMRLEPTRSFHDA